jgi:hypothetical protein
MYYLKVGHDEGLQLKRHDKDLGGLNSKKSMSQNEG